MLEEQINSQASRLKALKEAFQAFVASSLDFQAALNTVTRKVAELIGDACSVTLLSENGTWLDFGSFYHVDAVARELMSKLKERPIPVAESLSGRVVQSGRPIFLPQVLTKEITNEANSAYHAYLQQFNIHSLILVPLCVQGRVIGVLGISRDYNPIAYTLEDLNFLQDLADLAALAVENGRLYKSQQEALHQVEQTRQRLAFLSEASTVLAFSLDYQSTLQNLVTLAVPILAEICVVDLVRENGQLEPVAVAHADQVKEPYLKELTLRYPPTLARLKVLREVLKNGEPVVIPETPKALLYDQNYDTEHRRLIEEVGPHRSSMIVPLQVSGRIIGVMSLGITESGRRYNDDYLALAQELARRAVLAVENAQLYESQKQARADAEKARERLLFLSEMGAVLASSLDYETTIAIATHLAIPYLGDACAFDIVIDENTWATQRLAVSHVRVDKQVLMHELARIRPARLDIPFGIPNVLKTGISELHGEQSDAPKAAQPYYDDPKYKEILSQVNIRSWMIVPVIAREHVLGTLTFAITESDNRYSRADLALAEELARRVALAVDNARLYKQTQEALETQQELDYLKDLFVSMAGHELRTPLTSIKGYAQILERQVNNLTAEHFETGIENKTTTRIRQASQVISRQSERMNRLVRQLLDFSRLQNKQFELNYGSVNLLELIKYVMEQHQSVSPDHLLHLRTEETGVVGQWDESRVEQVLDNLIGNAIKYSPAHSEVLIGVERQDNKVIVSVQDKGYGIKPEHQKDLFDRFYRVRTKENRNVEGMGLGLYISHEVVTQHGGEIWLESQPDQGSTFYFSLPMNS